MATPIFSASVGELSGSEILLGVYAYTFQIYGDFAGYSDIARGVARWLGFDLMVNFRMPYLATTPSDFWNRWHISLSSWLRDYLYIPLGGNRGGKLLTYRNLMLTMVLGGLWHGEDWTFIIWGAFHGVILCIYRLFSGQRKPGHSGGSGSFIGRLIAGLVMFHVVCFSWLLFRAETVSQVWAMTGRCFSNFEITWLAKWMAGMLAFYLVPLYAYEYWLHRKDDILAITQTHWLPRAAVYSYMTLMLLFFAPEANVEFIYFQF